MLLIIFIVIPESNTAYDFILSNHLKEQQGDEAIGIMKVDWE